MRFLSPDEIRDKSYGLDGDLAEILHELAKERVDGKRMDKMERRKTKEGFQMEETNNYEKWCEQWREKFLKMDQEELKKRLPSGRKKGSG